MKVWPIIKAPLAVQFNRIVFALYATYFISGLWENHRTASREGWIIFSSFLFFSLLGIFYSCIRARYSPWIMSAIIIAIPAVVLEEMFRMKIFSGPQSWWEWLLDPLAALGIWFGLPLAFAVALFKDQKAKEYFTCSAT